MKRQSVLIYRVNNGYHQDSWKALGRLYALRFAHNLEAAISDLTSERVACIVTECPGVGKPAIDELLYFRSCFQTVPLLIYGTPDTAAIFPTELAGGSIRLILHDNLNRLVKEIPSLVQNYSFVPDLSRFGIALEQCPPRIKKALSMIQGGFLNKNLNVAKIALQLNVHRCHFEREFHYYCWISPKQLIIGLKLLFACFLMKNDGMKLLHIAPLAAFPDYYEFCKLFSNHLGMTPKAFRQTCEAESFSRHFSATKPQ